jgi:hypothetical protein
MRRLAMMGEQAGRRRAGRLSNGGCPLILLAAAALPGCARTSTPPPPPRVDTPADLPGTPSTIVVPISARLADLEVDINQQAPRALWSIDRIEPRCVPAQHVKLLGARLKVLPDLSCRITGKVTRGRIRLSGAGDRLHLVMPVDAAISAEHIGGIVKRETATGAASVSADLRLSMRPDWTPQAAVRIHYDWTDPPGVTLLGHRVTFVDKADQKLDAVVAKLQRDLPRQLARLDARSKVAAAWRQGFTAIELNHARPPVWMRVVPQSVSFEGYRVNGDRLELTAAARALTQTFVGPRPADPAPTPLPDLSPDTRAPSLAFQIAVLADYHELEPVLARALAKLATKGIVVPQIGPVDAQFGGVTIYATSGGRLAVGVHIRATPRNGLIGATTGQAWLTALPVNAPDSEVVRFRDLQVTASTDRSSVNVLLALVQTPAVLNTLSGALTQNFGKDYAKVLGSARRAIANKRLGDFMLAATIDRVSHGRIVPTGQGLFLPVSASGQATISYRPR